MSEYARMRHVEKENEELHDQLDEAVGLLRKTNEEMSTFFGSERIDSLVKRNEEFLEKVK